MRLICELGPAMMWFKGKPAYRLRGRLQRCFIALTSYLQTSVLTYLSLPFTVIIVPGVIFALSASSSNHLRSFFDCFLSAAAPTSTQKMFPSREQPFSDEIFFTVWAYTRSLPVSTELTPVTTAFLLNLNDISPGEKKVGNLKKTHSFELGIRSNIPLGEYKFYSPKQRSSSLVFFLFKFHKKWNTVTVLLIIIESKKSVFMLLISGDILSSG